MQRNETAQFIDLTTSSLCFLETQRVLNIVVKECSEQIKWVEVELLDCIGQGNVSTFIQVFALEDSGSGISLYHISSLAVDKIAIVVNRSALFIKGSLGACGIINWDDNVSLVITVKASEDVNLVEVTSIELHILNERVVHSTCLVSSLQHAHVHFVARNG